MRFEAWNVHLNYMKFKNVDREEAEVSESGTRCRLEVRKRHQQRTLAESSQRDGRTTC